MFDHDLAMSASVYGWREKRNKPCPDDPLPTGLGVFEGIRPRGTSCSCNCKISYFTSASYPITTSWSFEDNREHQQLVSTSID